MPGIPHTLPDDVAGYKPKVKRLGDMFKISVNVYFKARCLIALKPLKKLFNFCFGRDSRPRAQSRASQGGGGACVAQGVRDLLATGYSQSKCAVKNVARPRRIDGIDRKGAQAAMRRRLVPAVFPAAAGLSARDLPRGWSRRPVCPHKPGLAQGNDRHRGYLGKEAQSPGGVFFPAQVAREFLGRRQIAAQGRKFGCPLVNRSGVKNGGDVLGPRFLGQGNGNRRFVAVEQDCSGASSSKIDLVGLKDRG